MADAAIILDAIRHGAWASKVLIKACRPLSPDELAAHAEGFGSILATFNHYLRSDVSYAAHLGASRASWASDSGTLAGLDQLDEWVDDAATRWNEILQLPMDPEAVLVLEDGDYEVHAGVVIAQALHHANAHREQISAALTALGHEPPDVQPWAYADATGRGRWVRRR